MVNRIKNWLKEIFQIEYREYPVKFVIDENDVTALLDSVGADYYIKKGLR